MDEDVEDDDEDALPWGFPWGSALMLWGLMRNIMRAITIQAIIIIMKPGESPPVHDS